MDALVWLLALLGLWQLVSSIRRWFLSSRLDPLQVGLLFLVKDNQETVEGLFRQLALDCHYRDVATGKVMVFDLGSRDQSPAILRLLARDLGFLHLRELSESELGSALGDFDQGVLVLDLRRLSAPAALARARRLLAADPGLAREVPVNMGQ